MTPTLNITDEDEAALLESISKHNKLVVESFDCWCEDRIAEIQLEIELLRLERMAVIKKYEKGAVE